MTTSPPPPTPPFSGPLRRAWGDRLDPAALTALLAAPGRPLPAPVIGDRAAWSAVDPVTVGALRDRAEAERGTPWPQPLVSHYARYVRDGNRTDYEDRVRERQQRLTRAAVVAASDGTTAALDEVVDGVVLLCEQSSWSWAAHDDAFAREGWVLPRVDRPFLDLGAGEVAGQLAWIDAVLGTALDDRAPGLRERVRLETRERVIRPFLDRRDWHWLGLDGDVHNWNPWIHGNVVLAALALLDDPEERGDVVALALEGLDRYLASLPADGAIDEGFAYWWNGAGRALETLELLSEATGGRLDAADLPVVRHIVRFPHRMHLGGDRYVNVADGPSRASAGTPWHILHRWGTKIGDRDVVAHAAAQKRPGAPLADETAGPGRLLRALTDSGWAAATPGPPPLVARTWLPSVQLLVARERAGSENGLTLAVKAGHNGEHHNHLDVGSVIVALDGVPIVVDAGQPTYTAATFGPERYGIRAMQSDWHSLPVPWGLSQGVGAGFGASDASAGPQELDVDLATAYPLPPGSRLHRSARLGDGRVVLTDSWHLPRPASPAVDGVEVHLLLAGTVALDPEGAVVRPREGGRALAVRWNGRAHASLTEWPLDDPLLAASWGPALVRLTLTSTAAGSDPFVGRLVVELAPEEEAS